MADQEALTALRQQPRSGHAPQSSAPAGATTPAATANTDVCRVAVKLPPFWAESPEVWFAQVEAQFSLARIITQDRTRYDYVVAHLDSRYAAELRDVLASPPADDCYLHLKRELIRRLSPSQDEKAILQVQPNLPLDQLTEIADRVVEASPPPPPLYVHAAGAPQPTPELASRIDKIARQVDSIQRHLDQRPTLRPGKRPQSRGRNTDSSQENDDGRCYYHRRFGDRARKCQPACSVGRQGNFNSSP
ncbi:uncharacterized protein LOC119442272 [Dermacentor silvarum]|uniref:uncharacterized protein LOC119442272 n=1 Tax=Dermacentor silvarum TaxID=543639 RepID=UPI00189B2CC4|nr:uncharacterized protein LOC119442272 [Dermacentor silvarum]